MKDGSQADRIRKYFIKLFREEFDLKITIDTNLKIVNILDITLNLIDGTYKPFNKPNSNPIYIHTQSNHPPTIIKQIPSMISDRISNLSSSEEIFNRAAPTYNEALRNSGYKEKLTFNNNKREPKNRRNRKRNIIWFNPPFSANVKTNVAKRFLYFVVKNFPKNHRLHKLFNRNNLKVSYSCMPNVSSIISSHNKKILNSNESEPQNDKQCNCRKKTDCPINGKCLQKEVIYRCKVEEPETNTEKFYVGLTANAFKQRWYGHNHTFKYESKRASTELSNHVWDLQTKDIQPNLTWEIIDHTRPYVNRSKKCNLCLTEKLHIITSELDLVNKRSELISKCRHNNKFIIKNFKSVPPDKSKF